jgi:hypothetical protein
VHTFEKKELDLALVERCLAHLRKPMVPGKWQERALGRPKVGGKLD